MAPLPWSRHGLSDCGFYGADAHRESPHLKSDAGGDSCQAHIQDLCGSSTLWRWKSRCSALLPPLSSFPSWREWHKLDPSQFPREESHADPEQHVNVFIKSQFLWEKWENLSGSKQTWVNAITTAVTNGLCGKRWYIMLLNGTLSAISASGAKINTLGRIFLIKHGGLCCFSCPCDTKACKYNYYNWFFKTHNQKYTFARNSTLVWATNTNDGNCQEHTGNNSVIGTTHNTLVTE